MVAAVLIKTCAKAKASAQVIQDAHKRAVATAATQFAVSKMIAYLLRAAAMHLVIQEHSRIVFLNILLYFPAFLHSRWEQEVLLSFCHHDSHDNKKYDI